MAGRKAAARPSSSKRRSPTAPAGGWHVYIVRCADGTLYTGIARDLDRRIRQHNEGRGAKYTRSRRPVKLLWSARALTRSTAQRREARVRKLSKTDKLALASG